MPEPVACAIGPTTTMASIRALAEATTYSRDAIRKRVNLWNLGEDFDPKRVVTLMPLEEGGVVGLSLTEARTEECVAKTKLLDIQREKLEGQLADVDELIMEITGIFDGLGAIVKRSKLSDDEKADMLGAMRDHGRRWSERGGK